MKQIRYYMLAALATMMLVGCTEDNNMDAIPQPVPAGIPETDEVIKALSDIPGVTNVRLVDEENTDDYSGAGEIESLEANRRAGATASAPCYAFSFEQPIDHNRPELGTYLQACRLRYKGAEKNVVVLTHGYNMEYYDTDLATQLDANQLNIEHRYFGESLPEPVDNLDLTYLNSNQQARDIHNIVSALKENLFKTGKWASTGTSKDGITTALQAYWSDYYKWTDFDVYVPFCAPFMIGTDYTDGTHSCNDITPGTYLKDICGYGYEAGSKEAIAYERLRKIPQLICTNEKIRAAANKAVYQADPASYQKILEQYNAKSPMSTGDQTKDVTAFTLYTYYDALFSKFSYVQFYTWADIVPDLKPLEDGTATEDEWTFFMQFIVMDDKALDKYLADQQKEKTSQAMRGATKEEEQWDYLRFRRESPRAPYNIQAFTELGAADNDYSIANTPGSILTPADCEKVNYMFSTQALYEQCGKAGIYKQDGGYLMKDFRKWAETENTQPIIFVYAYNDPWTGGGIDDETVSQNDMLVKVVDGLATHTDVFLHREFYTKDSETKIVNALNKFLKLK